MLAKRIRGQGLCTCLAILSPSTTATKPSHGPTALGSPRSWYVGNDDLHSVILPFLAEKLLGWKHFEPDENGASWTVNGWALTEKRVREEYFPKFFTGNR